MEDIKALNLKLENLRAEHRDLDNVIRRLMVEEATDQLQMQRLKKHKLLLKDQILYYENELLPNIIA
jgi:hypothetical protein